MMLTLPGAPALSDFRNARLLATVRAQVPGISRLSARYVHFVQTTRALSADEQGVLEALLTYGPREGEKASDAGALIVVTPRPGTISPWSSKATDIAYVCGLEAIERIERGIAYRFEGSSLSSAELERIAPLLFDRMTEAALFDFETASQ